MKIDYLGHSGFLVETETAVLLFDYYRGDISLGSFQSGCFFSCGGCTNSEVSFVV